MYKYIQIYTSIAIAIPVTKIFAKVKTNYSKIIAVIIKMSLVFFPYD